MPNVTRGTRMAGLLAYLVGPGRANEHTEPHLVAGDSPVLAWHDDNELDHDSAMAIAAYLDRPRTAYDVEVAGGHVWHCSLSVRAEEGVLPDQQWAAIASDFITAMGFDDNQGTKAACRWAAVRHGLSKAGNDHIHLVVDLVREDGTKASMHRDYVRAQSAARDLERRYGLEELESAVAHRSTRGTRPGEREAAARARTRARYESGATARADRPPATTWEHLPAGDRAALIDVERRATGPREVLAIKVRGAAAASLDEAEFVRRLRREGVLARPRFADNGMSVVTGFSVALRPSYGERPIWYGGLSLARDLALPRLRAAHGWTDTPEAADAAVAEWNAARRGRRVVTSGREATTPSATEWERRATDLAAVVDQLAAIDVADRSKWATIAHSAAGMLSAWSNATEPEPGDLAAAAEALSRAAQTHRPTPPMPKAGRVRITGATVLLAAAAHSGQGRVAQAVMLRQIIRLTEALARTAAAGRQVRLAQHLVDDTRARLARLHAALPAPVSAVENGQRDVALRASVSLAAIPASPLPRTLAPHRIRSHATAGRAAAER